MSTRREFVYRPQLGCGLMLVLMAVLCLLPAVLVDTAAMILSKLHLPPALAIVALLSVMAGGLINIPLHRWQRQTVQLVPRSSWHAMLGWVPWLRRTTTQTILAVNVGGCLIPLGLAVYEAGVVFRGPEGAQRALGIAMIVNIALCYWLARPIEGVGIALPALAAPAAAVAASWILMIPEAYDEYRAPVAFVSGVAGPLIGADLFNLPRFARLSAGVISIGGAGTFDAIVLSGLLAALVA